MHTNTCCLPDVRTDSFSCNFYFVSTFAVVIWTCSFKRRSDHLGRTDSASHRSDDLAAIVVSCFFFTNVKTNQAYYQQPDANIKHEARGFLMNIAEDLA